MPIPVILCVDVEPDQRPLNHDAPPPWTGYELTQRYMAELRARIERRTGTPAQLNWFLRMDPQVAEAYGSASVLVDRYRGHIDDVTGRGDEVGLHTHAFRWLRDERSWLEDYADDAWVEHCVRSSIDAYAGALGRACTSHRFGGRWVSTAAVNVCERAGIRFDLSIEPGVHDGPVSIVPDVGTGELPDLRRVPRVPYTPSSSEFREQQRAPRAIRMVPLTSTYVRRGHRFRGYIKRLVGNRGQWRQSEPLAPYRDWEAPDTFDRLLGRALAAQERPYLAFAVRSDFALSKRGLAIVDASLDALLAHRSATDFVFCTPPQALAILEA